MKRQGRGIALGPIKLRDPLSYIHCNWEVTPSGTPRENAAIERLAPEARNAQ